MSINILNSFKWSAIGEIPSKVLPPLFYIITARLLTPDDFGIVATSAMIVAFASIIWEAGFSKAIIQNKDDSELQKMSNFVLFANLVLSTILYLIIFAFSDIFASFFDDSRVSDVLKVSGLSLILGSLMSVQKALLQKQLRFKDLFYSSFVGAVFPGFISVIFAYYSFGYWALVYGTIFSLFFQVIILWKISDWRPSFELDINITKKTIKFSKWVLSSALLSWFYSWGDIFVLGFFFTSIELGLYRTGGFFVGTIIGIITAPIVPVMFSYFSQIQEEMEVIKKALLFSSKLISFFVLPVGFTLFIFKDAISDLIFGDDWSGLAPVIGYLALLHSLSWIIGLNNSAYTAIGRPDVESKILIFNLIIYLIVYLISARISFHFFLVARFFLALVSIFSHTYASKKILKVGFFETFLNIKNILYVLTVLIIIYSFIGKYISSNYSIVLALISFAIIYLISIYFLEKKLLYSILNILKKRKINA